MNATLEGDNLTVHEGVNLGIAVSLGEKGLIVPVVHDAHLLSHEGLAEKIKDLAARARSNKLTPDEVRGGTFTITNPGRYGALMATPIISQPQVAILDLEAVVKRPVVVGGDSIAIRPMTYLCMSWDHRALDGAYAAQFLSAVRSRIEAWTYPSSNSESFRTTRRSSCSCGCATCGRPTRSETRCCCSSTRPCTRVAVAPRRTTCRWARSGTARRASRCSMPTAAAA